MGSRLACHSASGVRQSGANGWVGQTSGGGEQDKLFFCPAVCCDHSFEVCAPTLAAVSRHTDGDYAKVQA